MSEQIQVDNSNSTRKESFWEITKIRSETVKGSGFFEEKGIYKEAFYKDKPVIGRDKKINGGVYINVISDEEFNQTNEVIHGDIVLVDDELDSGLELAYQILMGKRNLAISQGVSFKDGLLEDVVKTVEDLMPTDENFVNNLVAKQINPKEDLIKLSEFFGGGICRHQNLLAGYLIERLIKEGHLRGKVSIDRNIVPGEGGHAWVRYTSKNNQVFILDSSLGYLGALEDIGADEWFYQRPDDTDPSLKKEGNPLTKTKNAFLNLLRSMTKQKK